MRLLGWCIRCKKFKTVRSIQTSGAVIGVCDDCEEEEA